MAISWGHVNSQPFAMLAMVCSTVIGTGKIVENIFLLGIDSGMGLEVQE